MTGRETLKTIREGILSGKCSDGNLAWIVNLCDESLAESGSTNAGNAAAMLEALELAIEVGDWCCANTDDPLECCEFSCAYQVEPHGEAGPDCPWKKIRGALSASARNQEVLAAPIDLNERFIHIGDSVHMLNTRDDGDHEWDDVVLSLEYVGKSGGDDWLVHGEDGAAWACECEVLNRKGEGDGK